VPAVNFPEVLFSGPGAAPLVHGTRASLSRTVTRSDNVVGVKIEKGRRIKLKVDLSVVGGPQLEKSTVEYIQGAGTMLPGLEALLEGLEIGAKRDGVLAAKDAFGNPAMHPIKQMKRSEFPKDVALEVGQKLVAASADAAKMNVILQVVKIAGDDIEVRLVHPLAEKDIKYAVEVVQVSDPRPPPVPAQAIAVDEEG
jgi:FKBP-type peptidyl-prolyl cis-trans isomerase 2